MLLLTDRAGNKVDLHDYLIRSRHCRLADLFTPPAEASEPTLVISDADVANSFIAQQLAVSLKRVRRDGVPVLFLARDDSETTVAVAASLGATQVVRSNLSPELIRGVADRLVKAQEARSRTSRPSAHPAAAQASEVMSALANCFDSIRRNEALSVQQIDKGADVVLSAVKTTHILKWLDVVREIDDVTFQHCLLVAGLIAAFSVKLGLTLSHQRILSQAALIHDIGKARIPPAILNKPGALTAPERAIMVTHAAVGHDMLVQQGGFDPVILDVVRHHHEYLDGSGYPDRLKGAQISGYVRISTICDIYAALVERRQYKTPMPPRRALSILAEMGPKLDAGLLKTFTDMVTETG